MLKRIRVVLWIACAIPLLALGAVGILELTQKTGSVGALQASGIGGPFKLAASTGGSFSTDELKGKPFLVFFGFTRCPEICPTTISDISTWLDALGSDGKEIKALFVSIDPERDDVASLKDYLSSFNDRIIGLTGTPDEIAAVAKEYRVYYAKHPLKDGDYTMDHSAVIYLMDRQGKLAGTLTYGDPTNDAVAKLKRLLASA
ncbi:protein SCO1/2 [Rhizobiales bacterium GAS191]|jgi:protein SCO1/2|nr:protein SCO1/2 [Rhizobiales bacterium GAS113]SEE06750.1 protein SCO1/2 [Rhizobiales bacterium GAS191]SEE47018.1 protein SCO1/2 [Rhizobiales bacterium GAS188]